MSTTPPLDEILSSLHSPYRRTARERGTGLRLASKFYPYESPPSLQGESNIFPEAARRQLCGWPKPYTPPMLPLAFLPNWEECTKEFAIRYPVEYSMADMTGAFDTTLNTQASELMVYWRMMLRSIEGRLDVDAGDCSEPLLIRGRQTLGFNGLRSLHAGLFGSGPVVTFFEGFNELCKFFCSPTDDQLCLYTALGPVLNDADDPTDGSMASTLSNLERSWYFGIGNSFRPYSHFAYAVRGDTCPDSIRTPLIDTLYTHCYAEGKVPFLAFTHTDKCSLFVQLMESSTINFFGEDRCMDMANKARGLRFPPILLHLLPDIKDNLHTFEAIAALYTFHSLVVESPSNIMAMTQEKAVTDFNRESARYRRLLENGKLGHCGTNAELFANSFTGFYAHLLASDAPLTTKDVCLASFSHPSIKSNLRTFMSSRLLIASHLVSCYGVPIYALPSNTLLPSLLYRTTLRENSRSPLASRPPFQLKFSRLERISFVHLILSTDGLSCHVPPP